MEPTQIIAAVLQGQPKPPSRLVKGLPAGLDDAVLHCLEGDRDRRCASVIELATVHAALPAITVVTSILGMLSRNRAMTP